MLVTKRKLERTEKELNNRIEWWVEQHRELRSQLWQITARHDELLQHLGLQQVKVQEHYEIRNVNG